MSLPRCRCGHRRSQHHVKCQGCLDAIDQEGIFRSICDHFDEMHCRCFHRSASHSDVIGEGCLVPECSCLKLRPLTREDELVEYDRLMTMREARRGYVLALLEGQRELDSARR